MLKISKTWYGQHYINYGCNKTVKGMFAHLKKEGNFDEMQVEDLPLINPKRPSDREEAALAPKKRKQWIDQPNSNNNNNNNNNSNNQPVNDWTKLMDRISNPQFSPEDTPEPVFNTELAPSRKPRAYMVFLQ